MYIVNQILAIVPSFLECFILWRLLSFVLDLKYKRIIATLATAIVFLLLQVKEIMAHIPAIDHYQAVISVVLLVYTFVMINLISKNTFIEKLIWWGVYGLGLIVTELGLAMIWSILVQQPIDQLIMNKDVTLFGVIVLKLITLLVFEIVFRKYKGKLIIGVSYFWELAVVIVFNLVLALILVYIFFNQKEMIVVKDIISIFFCVVLLITAYTVVLIFRIERKSNEEIATQLKLQQIELELKLNNDMVEITDKLSKLRHDMNNHIGLIKTLVKTGRYEELSEYVNQIYEDVEIANELVITNNKTLSVLLNAKKNLAKEKNIDFSSIIATQDLNIQSKDICSLLGNILDNAIEAAERSGSKKYIELLIQKTEKGCIINCENSIGNRPIVKSGKFITSKENSILHGIGTENIKDIVAKYNGEIEFEYDEDAFNVHVLLPV